MRIAAGLITILAGVGHSANAQDSTLVRAVRHARRVRIQDATGIRVEMRQPRVVGSQLFGVAWPAGTPVDYDINEIQQIWRRGSVATAGLAVGAGIGAIGGAIMGVALANFCLWGGCPSPSAGETLGAAGVGALAGGVTLGLVGALIAAPFQTWKTVYKADTARVRPIVASNRVGVTVTF